MRMLVQKSLSEIANEMKTSPAEVLELEASGLRKCGEELRRLGFTVQDIFPEHGSSGHLLAAVFGDMEN